MNQLSYFRVALLALVACGYVLLTPSPTLAAGYWAGFRRHWADYIGNQNGTVMSVIVIGVICVFIVTRGRWRK